MARYSLLGGEGRLSSEAPPSSLKTSGWLVRWPLRWQLLVSAVLGRIAWRPFWSALGNPVPRFVAEEADDSSGPVEAASVWPSWLYSKFILWPSFPFQNSINLAKLGSFFFVNFSDILCVGFGFWGCHIGNVVPFLSSSVIDDALNLPG
jgi:hypothetical protein